MLESLFYDELSEAFPSQIETNHPMALECTFRLGGRARYFFAPRDIPALQQALHLARRHQISRVIIGGGANLIFRDQGFPGLALATRGLKQCTIFTPEEVEVGAGLSNAELTDFTLAHQLTGFEWAGGLPGSVGGGIFMNAKCYGSSFSRIVRSVTALLADGELKQLSNSDCDFGYKHSVFQTNQAVILSARLALTQGPPETIRLQTLQHQADREQKGQFQYPSAGCVFKNDHHLGIPTGTLVEQCGLKGTQIGGVKVYEQHANFIVNVNQGKAQDVIDLMALIRQKVREQHHVELEPEIKIVP